MGNQRNVTMAAYGKSTGKSIGGLCPVERLKSAATSRSLRLEKHVSLTSGFSMAADSAKSAKVSKQISQFRELLDYFEHGIINQDPTVVGIVVAIALVLLTMCEYSLKFTIHLEGYPSLDLAT